MSGLIALNVTRMATGLGGFLAGVVLGFVHFGSLWWNVRLFAGGKAMRSFGLHLVRFALIAAGLWGLAVFGALPLVAGALGLMLARGVLLRRLGRVS